MSSQTTQKVTSTAQKRRRIATQQVNSLSYTLIGLCFAILLVISATNDYLFFEWLSLSAFIVFTLIGIHFIGQKQVKRN
ncbi:MAG: hypothetical protein ACFB0A_00400 [Croceivirga sp.]